MSTLFVNNLNTASGSTITIPTGKKLVGTDANSFIAPNHVIQTQFQQATDRVQKDTTSFSGFTGYNITITPTSASSKILITYGYHWYSTGHTANAWRGPLVRLMNVTTDTVLSSDTNGGYGDGQYFTDTTSRMMSYSQHQFLHSPNTTNAITYGLEVASKAGNFIDFNRSSYGRQGYIKLEEIGQ